MRNGNKIGGEIMSYRVISSYRTYEEWKHSILAIVWGMGGGSYRTYEEWKQYLYIFNLIPLVVLTVPMRNGNIVFLLSTESSFIVLTVPMRNGNASIFFFADCTAVGSYRTYEEWKPEVQAAITSNLPFLPYL